MAAGARGAFAALLLTSDVIVDLDTFPADLLGRALGDQVAGPWGEVETGLDDAAFGGHRRAAHVQRARGVHGHISGAGGQRQTP